MSPISSRNTTSPQCSMKRPGISSFELVKDPSFAPKSIISIEFVSYEEIFTRANFLPGMMTLAAIPERRDFPQPVSPSIKSDGT